MRKKTRFPLILLVLSIILIGCTGSVMNIKVIDSSSRALNIEIFSQDSLTGKKSLQKISYVSFYRVISDTKMDMIWSLTSKNIHSGEDLHQIIYGVIPRNFFAATAHKSIRSGDIIYITFDLEKSGIVQPLKNFEVKIGN